MSTTVKSCVKCSEYPEEELVHSACQLGGISYATLLSLMLVMQAFKLRSNTVNCALG